MNAFVNIFWNSEQHRLRALWRLLAQGLAWFALLFMSQAVLGIVVGIVALATQALTPQQLSDPAFVSDFFLGNLALLVALEALSLLITLATTWLAGRFLDRRRWAEFGFRFNSSWWIDFGFGLFLGAFLMAVIFLIELAAGWATVSGAFVTGKSGGAFPLAILIPVIFYVMVGISEELLYRGYNLKNMAEGLNLRALGPRWAILIATLLSSVIFGLMHAANPHATAISTFNIFLAGFFLAMGYLLTGELALPIGLHIAWNFFQGNVFGFPVSGTTSGFASFLTLNQGGPELWTGGAFGPEAGLLGVGAMVLGSLMIVGWGALRRRNASLHLALADPPAGMKQIVPEVGAQA